jgi:hypothetical protein
MGQHKPMEVRRIRSMGLRRRSGGGRGGGWGMRLVAVACCGAADRSVGSASGRAAAPGSLADLPQYSVFSNCSSTVTVSPSGPPGLFKGVTITL